MSLCIIAIFLLCSEEITPSQSQPRHTLIAASSSMETTAYFLAFWFVSLQKTFLLPASACCCCFPCAIPSRFQFPFCFVFGFRVSYTIHETIYFEFSHLDSDFLFDYLLEICLCFLSLWLIAISGLNDFCFSECRVCRSFI